MPLRHPAGRSPSALVVLALGAVLAIPGPAVAQEYRVQLNFNDLSQSTPLRRSASFPVGASNGTATYTGDGFAYPGHVGQYQRLDMTWSSGFSGGASSELLCKSRTTDFVVSGPAGPPVTATLHLRAQGSVSLLGGFAGNGAHQGHTFVRAQMNAAVVTGNHTASNFGVSADGVLSGQTGNAFDVPFTITTSVPVNTPFVVDIFIECSDACYGNNGNDNPGYVITDVGNASSPPVGGGLRLEEVGGVVMDVPAGYTVSSANWGISGNHFSTSVAVDPLRAPEGLGLQVTPNPAAAVQNLALTLPRAGDVRAAIFDAGGRRVRALAEGRFAAGASTLTWDGRDDRGGRVRAGLYFVRVSAAGRVLTRRIVRLE